MGLAGTENPSLDLRSPNFQSSHAKVGLHKFLQHKGAHTESLDPRFWGAPIFSPHAQRLGSVKTNWGRGSGGVKSTSLSQNLRETCRDESQCVSAEKESSKQGMWSSQSLRDLSQVVGRTPRDAPVPWPSPRPRQPLPTLELQKFCGPYYPHYGWDFPKENPEKFRKDPGNALRTFPGIPLESTAGIPQPL